MAATVFFRAGGERGSLDVLPRNTAILVEEFCTFIRAVENTVSVYTALVTLRKYIHQRFHDMLSHTSVLDGLVHHKSKSEFGVFLCVTKSLITKCKRQSIITANGSCIFNTEYRPIFLVINIDHK